MFTGVGWKRRFGPLAERDTLTYVIWSTRRAAPRLAWDIGGLLQWPRHVEQPAPRGAHADSCCDVSMCSLQSVFGEIISVLRGHFGIECENQKNPEQDVKLLP